jgi:hypothetical protein
VTTNYDSKENQNEGQAPNMKQVSGPLAFSSTNQLQQNNADDDPADEESSIVSELKTPTS